MCDRYTQYKGIMLYGELVYWQNVFGGSKNSAFENDFSVYCQLITFLVDANVVNLL
jgi:hypothetical protein